MDSIDFITNDVQFLSKLIVKLDINILSKFFSLFDDIPYIFDKFLNSESAPELSLRNDDSVLTKYVRTCIKYINPINIESFTQFKHILNLDIPVNICRMCFHLERFLYKHPKSHIIAVTAIITLRSICPSLALSNHNLAKDIMKVAGISSISSVDIDIDFSIKHGSDFLHICDKCKKWSCGKCTNPLQLDLSRISSNESESFSPRSFSPRNFFSNKESSNKESSNKESSKKQIKEKLISISPKNPYNKYVACYDNFCHNVVYKGYVNKSEKVNNILFDDDDLNQLNKLWIHFFDTEDDYIKYGNLLRYIYDFYKLKMDSNTFLYWDNLHTLDERKILYNNRNNGNSKWHKSYNSLFY